MGDSLIWLVSNEDGALQSLDGDKTPITFVGQVEAHVKVFCEGDKASLFILFRRITTSAFRDACTGCSTYSEVPVGILLDTVAPDWVDCALEARNWREQFAALFNWKGPMKSPWIWCVTSSDSQSPSYSDFLDRVQVPGKDPDDDYRLWRWEELRNPCQVKKLMVEEGSYRRYRAMVGEGFHVGVAPDMSEVMDVIDTFAATEDIILITGETGTGKGQIAKTIHFLNPATATKDFTEINLATIHPDQAEMVLFGYVKGAFRWASDDYAGVVERAGDGTLFLDELSNAPVALQPKLLYLLGKERSYRPVGGYEDKKCKARILVGAHAGLGDFVGSGQLLPDLYWRISAVEIRLPSLRDRKKHDLDDLIRRFIESAGCSKMVSVELLEAMKEYDWPGNIRELETRIKAACKASGRRSVIELRDIPPSTRDALAKIMLKTEKN